jgi:hypothetical protein
MKLFRELTEEVNYLVEENDGKKRFYIEGVFIQGAEPNRNGRIYPMNVLEKEVGRYVQDAVSQNRALGELNHPEGPNINLDRVSHIITELKRDGNYYMGKAKILETPNGKIVQNLLSEGVKIGVSTRGMGSLVEKNGIMEVQDDFRLSTAADIVADPSAPKAFVRGVMEGREWIFDVATNSWRALELVENTKKAGKKLNEEQMLNIFQSFIANITKK